MNLKIAVLIFISLASPAFGESLLGKSAPTFTAKNQEGVDFDLKSRMGQGYTVLFFYPKAGTPGCTKQACAFRDSVKVIRDKGGMVYGISADDVAAQKKFHDEHKMTFDLLSDADATIIKSYQVKMPMLSMAKRQTFILDDKLIVRKHFEDVDPAMDAKNVAKAIDELKAAAPVVDPSKAAGETPKAVAPSGKKK
jgi:thioredoxin-dependent peroxiredoxin